MIWNNPLCILDFSSQHVSGCQCRGTRFNSLAIQHHVKFIWRLVTRRGTTTNDKRWWLLFGRIYIYHYKKVHVRFLFHFITTHLSSYLIDFDAKRTTTYFPQYKLLQQHELLVAYQL